MNSTPNNKTLLWLVAIGFFMETLDSTIVNTALPTMARDLGVSPLSMQSIIIAYTITLAVFIPASGWLTDRWGTRRVYLSAIIIFTLGSLLSALSHNLTMLTLSRVLQGAGGSMLLPVGRLAVLRAFPGERYLPALSFVTMPALIGPLVGPTLGGWMVEVLSWHWIFLINIPIGLIGCFATYKAMPQDEDLFPRTFDTYGFIQMSAFMVCICYALDGLSDHHLSQGMILFLFIFGFVSLASYVVRSFKHPDPLVSFTLFQTRTFSIGILGNMFARIGSSCMPFLLPLFLQMCLNYSPLESGMTMLPLALAAIVAKRFVAPLVLKFGYRRFLMINTILVGLGVASFALVSEVETKFLRIIQFYLFGTLNSMQFTAMNTLTMKDLGKKLSSHGNTMFSMVQMVSMSFSVAAAGSLLATFFTNHDKLHAFHLTFFCMGAVTCTSAWIFSQLGREQVVSQKKLENLVDKLP